MQVNSSTLYDIGSNYSIKLNDKEVLVYEDDKTRESKKTEHEKLQAKEQDKKSEESKTNNELSVDEQRLVYELQARDSEVRAHESAHQSGGASTGGASFTYQQGPDGKMYAIGGEVSVSMQSGSTPDETIANARAVISSAMAPADPSGQDMAVASSARVMIMKAEQQKAREIQEEIVGKETYKNESDNNSNEEIKKIDSIDIAA